MVDDARRAVNRRNTFGVIGFGMAEAAKTGHVVALSPSRLSALEFELLALFRAGDGAGTLTFIMANIDDPAFAAAREMRARWAVEDAATS